MGLGDNNFDYLLKANTPAITGPLDMARSGATLAQLLQSVQEGNFKLQTMQDQRALFSDPRFLQALSGAIGGQGGSGQGGDGGGFDASVFAEHPYAAQSGITSLQTMAKNQADIGKLNADAAEARVKAMTQKIGTLANWANKAGDNPTPMNIEGTLRQISMLGVPYDHFGPLPDPGDQAGWATYMKGIGAANSTPEQQQNTAASVVMTPINAAKGQADTLKALVEAQLAPGIAQTGRIGANAAAQQAATHQADVFAPKVGPTDVTTGLPTVENRFAVGGPSISTLGTAPQTALAPAQVAQQKVLTETLTKAGEGAQVGQRVEQILPSLEAFLRSGYQGPIASSEMGKTALQAAGTVGMLTQAQMDKLANMRGADAMMVELIGPMAKEMSTRGSNMALNLVKSGKAGPENSLEASLNMVGALRTDAQNLQSYNRSLNTYVKSNPTDLGLIGFKAAPAAVATPAGGKLQSIPMAAAQYLRAHPDTAADFDAKYGAGASRTVLP